jgi:hypothetical protein
MKSILKGHTGIKIIFDTDEEKNKFFDSLNNDDTCMCIKNFIDSDNACAYDSCSDCWKAYISFEVRNSSDLGMFGLSRIEIKNLQREILDKMQDDIIDKAMLATNNDHVQAVIKEIERKYRAIFMGLCVPEDDIDVMFRNTESAAMQTVMHGREAAEEVQRMELYAKFDELITDTMDDPLYNAVMGSGDK